MPKLRDNLNIACALDPDVLKQILKSKPILDRARYDFDVVWALKRLFGTVHLVPVGDDIAQALKELKRIGPDVVFNLAFSAVEGEAAFVGCLDLEGLAYTGSGLSGIVLSSDKIRSKELLRVAGVRVPRFVSLTASHSVTELDLTPPVIVKPAHFGGCSIGIYNDSIAKTQKAALACARRVWTRFGVPAVCEEFVVGRELRIGVVEDIRTSLFRVVGITECLFPTSSPGWGFKNEGIRINPRVRRARRVTSIVPKLTKPILAELAEIADIATRTLDLRGYASIDVRLDDFGRSTVIEVNSNPGLSRRSLIWSRPSFTHNIRQIVRSALSR